MFKKNNPGCPCCDACEIGSDDFNRADSSDLGSKWSERSGTWDITSNQLVTASDNALVRFETAHPDSSPTGYITASVKSTTSGDEVRIVFDYVDDSNYHFVALVLGGSATLRLWKRTAGVNSAVGSALSQGSLTATSARPFIVCISDTRVSASVGGGDSILAVDTTLHGGEQVGLGTGSIGTATFDDFIFGHSVSTNEDCNACMANCTNCTDEQGPLDFIVTIAGVTDGTCTDCDDVNGTYVVPYFSDAEPCTWRYFFPVAISSCSFDWLSVYVRFSGGNYFIEVQVHHPVSGDTLSFFNNYAGDAPECLVLDNTPLEDGSGLDSFCDNTAATCHVTSVA